MECRVGIDEAGEVVHMSLEDFIEYCDSAAALEDTDPLYLFHHLGTCAVRDPPPASPCEQHVLNEHSAKSGELDQCESSSDTVNPADLQHNLTSPEQRTEEVAGGLLRAQCHCNCATATASASAEMSAEFAVQISHPCDCYMPAAAALAVLLFLATLVDL